MHRVSFIVTRDTAGFSFRLNAVSRSAISSISHLSSRIVSLRSGIFGRELSFATDEDRGAILDDW
jgi:hypothetical protein